MSPNYYNLGKRDPVTNHHVPIWGKCANVTLSAVGGSKLVSRLARDDPQSWRYIFYLQTGHDQRSASLARKAGSIPKVVVLVGDCKILLQQGDPVASALQWADKLNYP